MTRASYRLAAQATLLTVAGFLAISCTQGVTPSAASTQAAVSNPDSTSQAATTISWKGYTWTVKSGSGMGPGPNTWNANNVFVDANGYLHLKITNNSGVWNCAELYTTSNLGFGTYQWQVEAPLDTMDPWIIFGMFPYGPAAGIGTDGTNEIDIECGRWGTAGGANGWWTVYPYSGSTVGQKSFTFSLGGGTYTTHRFTWNASSVAYRMMGGFQSTSSTTNTINSWTYAPTNSSKNIPQKAMPLHINLWLFQGHAPSAGTEVIIHDFTKI